MIMVKEKLRTKYLWLFLFFGTIIFCSCASGSTIVTGNTRAAIDAKDVKIYLEFPENYEVIAIVTASSDMGWTEQGDYNYAIEELKKQAAKVGANGVVIEKVGEENSGYVFSYGVAIPAKAHSVTGKAIFVDKKNNDK